jgi:hypothetical protein
MGDRLTSMVIVAITFGNQEFFTEVQRQELDRQRAAHYGNDLRQERGSAVDVGGAYNTEPRCIEGNFGLPGLLHGRRVEERAFAEGRGPDPRTKDNVGGVQSVRDDPLQ